MKCLARWLAAICLFSGPAWGASPADGLSGLVMDDTTAEWTGEWKKSGSIRPFVGEGYQHDQAEGKGEKSAKFVFRVAEAGAHQLLVSYTASSNRAADVPITVQGLGSPQTVTVNQRQAPPWRRTGFLPLGVFEFSDVEDNSVLIETSGTSGHVIVDAIRVLTAAEFAAAEKAEGGPAAVAVKRKPAADAKPELAPQAPQFVRQAASGPAPPRLTSEQFDRLLGLPPEQELAPADEFQLLRRLTLDLLGRQPTWEEYRAFVQSDPATRGQQAIERCLASPELGRNWANYWSDIIAARQPEPQLTFLNYDSFRGWLADQFNSGAGWDESVFKMLTAIGKVGDAPQGAFVGFHQGERNRVAGELSRVFLGVQIACAECHDHPFVDMPQETFHGMAAFFARVQVKLPWNDSDQIVISSDGKGEHQMPGAKEKMPPTVYQGTAYSLGSADLERREHLANWVVRSDNPFFARAFVNHLQARLLGRGFYDPIDDLGDGAEALRPEAHEALAAHLVASEFDIREVLRVIVGSRSYQARRREDSSRSNSFSGGRPKKLRGDEVFESLVNAVELPNRPGAPVEASEAVRFPPPPKDTCDLVRETFGYDPSTRDALLTRTMKQAMFLMNHAQILEQVDADPHSDTMLAALLREESDDDVVIDVLYGRVLARGPSARERAIVSRHLSQLADRRRGFEDVLWSLLNSAEFTTRN